jgi:hypothetical protein
MQEDRMSEIHQFPKMPATESNPVLEAKAIMDQGLRTYSATLSLLNGSVSSINFLTSALNELHAQDLARISYMTAALAFSVERLHERIQQLHRQVQELNKKPENV